MENYIVSPEDSFFYEKVISFLVSQYNKSGNNPKPVILHSIRIGLRLMQLGYEKNIVSASFLHDLVEDSDVTKSDIKKEFGKDIANLVSAVTFKPEIEDKTEQYKEMFARTSQFGRSALIIKCVDTFDNGNYIILVQDIKLQKLLIDKMKYFLDLSKDVIGKEIVWKQLYKQWEQETERIKDL